MTVMKEVKVIREVKMDPQGEDDPQGEARVIQELAGKLSSGRLITDPDVIDGYRRDHAHPVRPGAPLAVLLAESVHDVSVALAWAYEHGIPVVPRGAGTGLAGGATATDGCLVLSTERMTAIREVSGADAASASRS